MRTEKEMMDLIINTAKKDERIRAVQMQGSRTNPHAPPDHYRDYDICYYVCNIESFIEDPSWINQFGKRLMLQFLKVESDIYLYSMLFTDGNRIDLVLLPERVFAYGVGGGGGDDEAVWLYVKDALFKPRPPATHNSYNVKKPDEENYNAVCNRFWWFTQYVAKGVCRDELPYAMHYLNHAMGDELHKMLEWHIGHKTGYTVSAGKHGKYFKRHLDARLYGLFCKTYTGHEYKSIAEALYNMCDLFREVAVYVANHNGFTYPKQDDENMVLYLRQVLT
jgi:aminoglycoside 6-adenylyltransferase